MARVNDHYCRAISVVSPMYDGEEKKDQDRAVWFESSQTACVCDGVTSSPYSAEAAELVSQFSRFMFSDDVEGSARTISGLLNSLRAEKLRSGINLPDDVPATMQGMLLEAARRRLKQSHQTTAVAAQFAFQNGAVRAKLFICGDSMFLGFDSAGQLLTSFPPDLKRPASSAVKSICNPSGARRLIESGFAAGDEILAKVLGKLTKYPLAAERLRIGAEHRTKWIVCRVLDKCGNGTDKEDLKEKQILTLSYGERIVVPRYLVGSPLGVGSSCYVSFPCSRMIRTARSRVKAVNLNKHGAVTAVLPDHFYTGDWTYSQDRFPPDAQFILATDGFYGCFKDPSELWSWLQGNKHEIQSPEKRVSLLEGLHKKLRQRSGDDDISFVWVFPRLPGECPSQTRKKT